MLTGQLTYAAGVVGYSDPGSDSYTRQLVIRSVGWVDLNGDGVPEPNEPQEVVEETVTFSLSRSQVFDYSYFINNFGWMDGFGPNDLVVNGDMRANGDFSFTNGSPTVNGSVYAAQNNLLVPGAAGIVNTPPLKWSDSTYNENNVAHDSNAANNENRWRPGYNPTTDGTPGSDQFENSIGNIFMSEGQIVNNGLAGAGIGDVNGLNAWSRPNMNNAVETLLDSTPSQQVIMPDLSNLGTVGEAPDPNGSYIAQSEAYVDTLQAYNDGTPNPNYGKGAFLEVWNPSQNNGQGAYVTVSSEGVVNGSVVAVGTQQHPLIIHGPISVTQDILIKGYVSGQGTVYAGRNVHIVGSIVYQDPPNFLDGDPLGAANQKSDVLALAARGSVIMGNTAQFYNPYPLAYMMPPFTQGRYDQFGNWIPPYNATSVDSTGHMLYQTVLGDSVMNSVAEPVNQIDAVLYTNFVGGGDIGTGGNGFTLNGSIISKDEAMVTWSLPMRMNYDERIRERSLTQSPLIDLQLPRSPQLSTVAWQDLGFSMGD